MRSARSNFAFGENISFSSRQTKNGAISKGCAMTGPVDNGALRSDLCFPYRVYQPVDAAGETLVLLHGSGVDETTLAPLARAIAPGATLMAGRGRVAQDDGWRWFTRITPTRFEQQSIRSEADALAGFIDALAGRHELDLSRTTFV